MATSIGGRGRLAVEDLVAAAKYTWWRRSLQGKALTVIFGVVALSALGDYWAFGGASALGAMAVSATLLVVMIRGPQMAIKTQIKRAPAILEEGEYLFDESGFRISRPSMEVKLPWKGVNSVVELQDLFVVYSTKIHFYSVPKRFFAAGEIGELEELIGRALKENSKELVLCRK